MTEIWTNATVPLIDTSTLHVTPMPTRSVWPYRIRILTCISALIAVIVWWLI